MRVIRGQYLWAVPVRTPATAGRSATPAPSSTPPTAGRPGRPDRAVHRLHPLRRLLCQDQRLLASGSGGVIYATTNGGTTWTSTPPPPRRTCTASSARAQQLLGGGQQRRVVATTSGGQLESAVPRHDPAAVGHRCADSNNCVADGAAGTIVRRPTAAVAGGRRAPPGPQCDLWGISCADAKHCWAVGQAAPGEIDATTNGGGTWATSRTRPPTPAQYL